MVMRTTRESTTAVAAADVLPWPTRAIISISFSNRNSQELIMERIDAVVKRGVDAMGKMRTDVMN